MTVVNASALLNTAQGGLRHPMAFGRQDPKGRTTTTTPRSALQRSREQRISRNLLSNKSFIPMPSEFSALPPQLRQEGHSIRSTPSANSTSSGQQQPQQEPHDTATPFSEPSQGPVSSNSIVPFDRKTTLPSPDGGPGVVVEPDDVPECGNGALRMTLEKDGWRTWNWRGHAINWTAACPEDDSIAADAPIVVLIHGFGGSVYHWRRTLPALASKSAKVYALDCLGFGWSEKVDNEDYSDYIIWADQVNAFVEEVAGGSEQNRVVLVGNSLGGFTALQAASHRPDLVKGVVLINACGDIQAKNSVDIKSKPPMKTSVAQVFAPVAGMFRLAASVVTDAAVNMAARAYFQLSKKPENVRYSMERVYVHKHLVDDNLLESVVRPTQDPGAFGVCRAVLANMFSVERLDAMLDRLTAGAAAQGRRIPMLVLWGERDPWMPGTTPDRIMEHYDSAKVVRLPEAGHCPQDDAAEDVNAELMRFLEDVQVDCRREMLERRPLHLN